MAIDRTVGVTLRLYNAQFMAAVAAAGKSTKQLGKDLDTSARQGKQGMSEISAAAGVAGVALLGMAAFAVKAAMDFDKQMSAVGAATGATADQMGLLRDAALEAGAATKFSATEAAQGQEALAKAGVSVADILGGALTGALDLAASGNLSVADSAEVAASAMTTFGLSGAAVPHIADLLAAAAGKAQGEVSDMALALRQSSAVAAQMGLSIEDTTGALAMFASAGLTGSDAGTSFKQMLLSLIPNSEKAAGVMQDYGLSFFDANGEVRSFSEIAGQLQSKLGGLTKEQQASALKTLFGADAYRVAAVAMEQGAEGADEWRAKVDDTGYAAEQAAKKTDNLAGDLERLRGSLETALIKTGSGATGALRGVTQGLEALVNQYGRLPGAVQGGTLVVAATTGTVLALAGAYGTLAPRITVAMAALRESGKAGNAAASGLGKAGKAAGVAGAAFVAVQAGLAIANAYFPQVEYKADALARSLTKLADTGKATGDVTEVLGVNMAQFHTDLSALTSGGLSGAARGWSNFNQTMLATVGYTGQILGPFDDAKNRIESLDAALANMVSGGNTEQAAQIFARMTLAAQMQGVEVSALASKFPGYTEALAAANDAAGGAKGPTDALAGTTKNLGQEAAEAKEAIDGYVHALQGMTPAGSVMQATVAYQQALAETRKTVAALSGATNAQRTEFDLTSKSGQTAATSLLDLASKGRAMAAAALQVSGDTEEMNRSLRASRQAFIGAAVDAGLTKRAAELLANSLGLIPEAKQTRVAAPGAVRSTREVKDLDKSINDLNNKIVIAKASGAAESSREVRALRSQIAALRGKRVEVFVDTYRRNIIQGDTRARGGGGNTMGGVLKADGGIVEFYASGGIREDHRAQIVPAGSWRVFGEPETGGEGYIPLGAAKRSGAKTVVEDIVGRFGGAVAWANGGINAPGSAGGRMYAELSPRAEATIGALADRVVRVESVIRVDSREIARANNTGQRRLAERG